MNGTVVVKVVRIRPAAVVVAAPAPEQDEYLTIEQVCAWLGVSDQTIRDWRKRRGLPAIKIGDWVRFHRPTVEAWIAAQAERDAPTPLRRVS